MLSSALFFFAEKIPEKETLSGQGGEAVPGFAYLRERNKTSYATGIIGIIFGPFPVSFLAMAFIQQYMPNKMASATTMQTVE